jgi:prophage regulatory protein
MYTGKVTICQLASSDVQHLIDINDVADMLGITRQGAYKLVERDSSFPAPEVEVTAGRIWRTEDVEHWVLAAPGRRRAVCLSDKDDPTKVVQFRLVVGPHGVEVIIPTGDLDKHPALRWARKLGRFEEADRLNPARRYVPIEEWDERISPAGQVD